VAKFDLIYPSNLRSESQVRTLVSLAEKPSRSMCEPCESSSSLTVTLANRGLISIYSGFESREDNVQTRTTH